MRTSSCCGTSMPMTASNCHSTGDRARVRGLQRPGAVVGQRERDRLAQLGDADRRDQHDHARRLEQPPDHRELDDRAGERADGPAQRSATASTASACLPAITASSAAAGTPRSPTAKLMTRRRAVHEHDAHRDQRDDQPADDADEDEVPGDDGRERHQPPSVPKNTARARSSRSSRSVGGALEAHLALLQEDRPVGDRERDVERLLDDDHRLAARLELARPARACAARRAARARARARRS